jgi:hypothetical protein
LAFDGSWLGIEVEEIDMVAGERLDERLEGGGYLGELCADLDGFGFLW